MNKQKIFRSTFYHAINEQSTILDYPILVVATNYFQVEFEEFCLITRNGDEKDFRMPKLFSSSITDNSHILY